DGQAQPRAVADIFGREERIEDMRQMFGRNASASVAHADWGERLAVFDKLIGRAGNLQPPAVWHRLQTVAADVQENLMNQLLVNLEFYTRVNRDFEPDLGALGVGFDQFNDAFKQVAGCHRL